MNRRTKHYSERMGKSFFDAKSPNMFHPLLLTLFVLFISLLGNILQADDKPTTPTKSILPPPPPKLSNQVRINMKVLEWTTDVTDEYGFRVLYARFPDSSSILEGTDLTLPMTSATDSGMRFFFDNMMSSAGSFEAVVECLEQYGSVEVLSEPNVICPVVKKPNPKDPYQAKITTGSKIPFEKAQPVGDTLAQVTDFRDVGVTLNVGVHDIVNENLVKLLVRINVKNLAGYISVGTNKEGNPLLVPELTSREITNTLLAENEKTLITGLLVNQSITKSGMGVPWISKIPILGWLFSNRKATNKRQELVFLLRPEIIYD
ncbi:type II and III secretion system protein [Candidatus Sumerlaeota bacterium]|nr:type II and III secretion system protein [Candidatus Sumerlaeota bacterium]